MYCVYIIYSRKLNRFYTGTTDNFKIRLIQHNSKTYPNSFTCKGIPWISYHIIDNLTSKQAYDIERHIKKMKSKKYLNTQKSLLNCVTSILNKFNARCFNPDKHRGSRGSEKAIRNDGFFYFRLSIYILSN